MTTGSVWLPHKYKENILSAISAGFFFILIGAIFVITPNLFDSITSFFGDFGTACVPNTEIYLPAPKTPSAHLTVYSAAERFALAFAIFEVAMLILRFIARSPLGKKAETASNIAFWFGAYYLIQTSLNETLTMTTWFAFWATIIALIGVSLIIRAVVLAAGRMRI